MTYTSYPFDSQDTTEAQYSALFRELQDSGVVGSYGDTTLAVGANSSAMSVTLQPGAAIVRGFYFNNDAVATLPIGTSGASVRYDAVVLQLDPSTNSIVPVVKANATQTPALTQTTTGVYEILLAVVTVPASAVTIASGNVADKRNWTRHRIDVRPSTNRAATPRAYEVGIATDLGGRIEIYEPGNGWQNRHKIHWGTGTAFPTSGLQVGDTYTRSDLGSAVFEYNGSQWQAITPVYGKMWRVGGFSGGMTAATVYTVSFTNSRTSGGVAFDGPATPRLTVPVDGLYTLRGHTYSTTGTGYDHQFSVIRTRASVADAALTQIQHYKASSGDVMHSIAETVPLAAGDKIWMTSMVTGASGGQYWGTSENAGVTLGVYYHSPLNGATPL